MRFITSACFVRTTSRQRRLGERGVSLQQAGARGIGVPAGGEVEEDETALVAPCRVPIAEPDPDVCAAGSQRHRRLFEDRLDLGLREVWVLLEHQGGNADHVWAGCARAAEEV